LAARAQRMSAARARRTHAGFGVGGADGAVMLVARARRTHAGLSVGGAAAAGSGNLGVAKEL